MLTRDVSFPELAITAREHDIIAAIAAHAPVITLPHPSKRRHHPRPAQSQTQGRSRSSSQNGIDHPVPPSFARHVTHRPTNSIPQSPQVTHMMMSQHHPIERGRHPGVAPLRMSRTVSAHASPPYAYSMPVSATASPPFPPAPSDREYVLHLNSMGELAYVLFHNPRALATLRDVAAARFVAWREREREGSQERTEEVRSAQPRSVGFLGFEDVDAGQSDREEGLEFEEGDDEDMIMRTMWKLGDYAREDEPSGAAATLRPLHPTVAAVGPTREPLPLFNAPSSVAETSSSARQASPSPSPPLIYSTIRRRKLEHPYGEGSGTPLARSVYHDPLHIPSLLALAVSVLPRMIGGVFGFGPSRTRSAGRTGRGKDGGRGEGWSGFGVLIGVGAACAATFCAGWVCGFWMA